MRELTSNELPHIMGAYCTTMYFSEEETPSEQSEANECYAKLCTKYEDKKCRYEKYHIHDGPDMKKYQHFCYGLTALKNILSISDITFFCKCNE